MPQVLGVASGIVERIGRERTFLIHRPTNKTEIKIPAKVPDHNTAIKLTLDALIHPSYGVIRELSQIRAVGHRVVHGGEEFSRSVLITKKVIKTIKRCFELAPLHNPPNLLGIMACRRLLPGIVQVAVFDTAFYQSMSPYAYVYGLPYKLYKRYSIRRYGFHGTSHKYVAIMAAKTLKRPLKKLKLVTCHLGNGCSITATEFGKAVDTSMGFTPLEGLLMGTRCGDIDPAVVFYLMDKEKLTVEKINDILNKKSGLLGLSGISNDMRDVYKAAQKGNKRAKLAFEVFVYRIQKYIGAYAAAMGGLDAIVFTAGIGENHAPTRKAVCKKLGFLGKVKVLVIPTNEELMIAQDTFKIVKLI